MDDARIRQLKELCQQAEILRDSAEQLLRELSAQLDRSIEANPPDKAHDWQHLDRRRTERRG